MVHTLLARHFGGVGHYTRGRCLCVLSKSKSIEKELITIVGTLFSAGMLMRDLICRNVRHGSEGPPQMI